MSFHTFRSKDQQFKISTTNPVTPKAYNFGYILE